MRHTEIDISHTAVVLVWKHADRATIHAAVEADAALDAGDMDGPAHWRLVLRAVREMVEPEGVRH